MSQSTTEQITGRVVKLLGDGQLLINVGLDAGVKVGDGFVIFELGDEIVDPDSGQSLGQLERVKAQLVVFHAQPLMAQLVPIDERDGEARVLSAVMADTRRHAARKRAPLLLVGDHVRRVG